MLLDKNGQLIAYLNGGASAKAPYGWIWSLQNNGMPIALGVGAKREDYRWADVNVSIIERNAWALLDSTFSSRGMIEHIEVIQA